MLLIGAILLVVFGVLGRTWGAVTIIVAAIVEVGETGFWIWLSKRNRVRAGAETLIGARATVVAACHPEGQVRLRGELWRARCTTGADAGDEVVVRSRDGLTLLVEPASN
jgi:membrane-bound serine protease (ClpP class)